MNIAVAKQLDYYTIEDIYNLPDGQRAELIEGELYMKIGRASCRERVLAGV